MSGLVTSMTSLQLRDDTIYSAIPNFYVRIKIISLSNDDCTVKGNSACKQGSEQITKQESDADLIQGSESIDCNHHTSSTMIENYIGGCIG